MIKHSPLHIILGQLEQQRIYQLRILLFCKKAKVSLRCLQGKRFRKLADRKTA